MNAAQLFVKALEDEGVEVIYAVPGEQKRGVNAFWNQFCVLLEPGPRFSE
jgi:sRNA-binding regulator protein Hfq